MKIRNVSTLLQSVKGIRVGIIGDVMLDVYVHGTVDRISPEAPVPIIHITSEEYVLGGAANVAHNIVSLGGEAVLLGVVGEDAAGDKLVELCDKNGIGHMLLVDKQRATTEKKRIVSMTQQILRIDSENTDTIKDDIEQSFVDQLDQLAERVDVICVADYAKGVMTPKVIKRLLATAKKHRKKIVVDAKPRNMLLYKNVDVLTPNRSEVQKVSACDDPEEALLFVMHATKSPVLMTCGSDGMELCTSRGKTTHVESIDVDVVDVSGAGDTVTAVTALLRAKGIGYAETAHIASHAASIVITKLKTASVSQAELLASLTSI